MVKVGMVFLGCPKNQVDAEILLNKIACGGYELCADAALADVAIVNTCGFIESAKQEAIEEIMELGTLKAEGQIKKLIVTGCLAQRYAQDILNSLPEVDAVVTLGCNADICSVIERVLAGERVMAIGNNTDLPLEGDRVQTTPRFFAYLKIAEGCDNCCSYCTIPSIRGHFRSRKMEDVIAEAKTLARGGVRELIVVAQDTTRYGEDIYGELKLSELLRELCKVEELRWIRIMYCYPDRITDELLDTIANEEKIVKYMDIPLQHVCGDILKAMNRRGNEQSIEALIAKIRERVPGIVLRTTFITGFPGETNEQFEQLCEFIKRTRFERLGCFGYSAEEGTAAAGLEGAVDAEEIERREQIITEQQLYILDQLCEAMVGQDVTVSVESYDRYAECFFGRSFADAPDIDCKVFFTAKKRPSPGEFVTVHIEEAIEGDLFGKLKEDLQ